MSYNIHYGIGMNKENSLKDIAGLIKETAPDIVGLQEIGDSAMAAELGQLTGMYFVFGPSLGKMDGYGDAVLSKYPIVYDGNHSIPSASSSRYQVMALTVDLSTKSPGLGKVRLINTHFDWLKTIGSKHARLSTVDVIEEAFFNTAAVPTILTGDFNAEPGSEEIAKLKKYGWTDSGEPGHHKTIPSTHPTHQIDYIFFRGKKDFAVKKFSVLYGVLSSDHLPVVAELELIRR
ncbi:endonuclease/exonuclease/phosphatase family protein [Chitinophaga rhizosphaerae]|uniref:endonuclease/exonuclease/phosphatase family protein n=1 Tax=Chitinophaga rhizosphaerae TaxID=1864947 RepID=UPI0013DF58D6|nr:endonuclease/exonuclease/phosphatase family protein [Chitinophaga rhizosphaerae]